MIAQCLKCYYVEKQDSKKKKRQNNITWQRFKVALNSGVDIAANRGCWMATYEQQKVGLSTYYDKCWLLPDGIHTKPIEFHMK